MRSGARVTGLPAVGLSLLGVVLLILAVETKTASAATPCHSVEVRHTKIRVAVARVSCDIGREVTVGYYERLAEERFDGNSDDGSIYLDVDGFRCLTALAGSQMFCRHHHELVYASSRPEDHPANFDKPPPSGSSCATVHTGPITGRMVETTPGFGCSGARKVMKKYFRLVLATAQTEGGCAQKRSSTGCGVGDYLCHTSYSHATNELHGVCSGPKGRVRFEEIDKAPNA
jgi:hypothetical protein